MLGWVLLLRPGAFNTSLLASGKRLVITANTIFVNINWQLSNSCDVIFSHDDGIDFHYSCHLRTFLLGWFKCGIRRHTSSEAISHIIIRWLVLLWIIFGELNCSVYVSVNYWNSSLYLFYYLELFVLVCCFKASHLINKLLK